MDGIGRQFVPERQQRFFDPVDRAALAQREGRSLGGIGLEESRSIVRCCSSVSTINAMKVSITTARRWLTSLGGSAGSKEVAVVSGWAAESRARWFGKYRYAVGRDTSAAAAACSTVGVTPAATNSRAAATRASLVRCFCRLRPPVS